ncbi:DUF4232 domain-containing protein [Streptomyces spectabilis]|uniref:DUF4232 domain-containing protein n=1 Tax=Streptomyces spectabilis TaxID=68270 RepID=A0A516RBG2_STRST|nr:DUF4232 domain-containing protein [Streptomyces spectabilis]QDQ12983.1 DUF4232 domain-containing protein [Streptomyces spectabilis]
MRTNRRTAAALVTLTAALSLTTLAGTATAAAPAKAAAPVACSAATTKVTVKQVDRPINHLLLTAKNTGTKTCYAYNAPYLRFDEAQSATQVVQDSRPQAVVTLKPGQSAYAGIGTSSPEGEDGYDAKKLGVLFSNRAANGSVGSTTHPKLPGGSVYVDSSAFVTYWQSTAADALHW